MTEPKQWAEAMWDHLLNKTFSRRQAIEAIQRAFEERERELREALTAARKIIADIDDYMKRPGRGDWGEECACCMGELLDDDRQAIAKIDQALATRQPTPTEGSSDEEQ